MSRISANHWCSEAEPDIPDTLPPLGPDDGDSDDSTSDELGEFLEPLAEDFQHEDDEPLTELDVGVDLGGVEAAPEPDAEPLEIDLRDLVEHNETSSDASGDEFGPVGFDVTVGLDPTPADFTGDDADGSAAATETAIDAQLPPLDADGDGDAEGAIGVDELTAATEEPIPPSKSPWLEVEPRFRVEAVSALTVSNGHALAGSGDLLWIQSGAEAPLRLAAEDSRLTSVALLGAAYDSALCVTATGRLLRRPRLGPTAVLSQFREVAGLTPGQLVSLELCPMGPGHEASALLSVSTGKLLISHDLGATFQTVELPGRVLALSTTSDPAMALLETRTGVSLWSLAAAPGGSELAAPARTIAQGRTPLIAAKGQVVAIADSERGTAVSRDGGRHFEIAAGCVNTTAIAAGMLHGEPSVWVAVYRETDDTTDIVHIDTKSFTLGVIARIEAPSGGDLDPSDSLEQARVLRLAWDETTSRLWAAGSFGLMRFGPP